MRAIKEARKFIEKNPGSDSAKTLSRLVLALESEADFPISDIYLLDYDNFNLALAILQEWRLDRHYAGKSRLFDISRHVADLHEDAPVPQNDAPRPEGSQAPASRKSNSKDSKK